MTLHTPGLNNYNHTDSIEQDSENYRILSEALEKKILNITKSNKKIANR